MKEANAMELRDVPATTNAAPLGGDKAKRQRIEELLRRYPGTSDAETAEIRHFLATGSHLDVGLVSGSDEFREKVSAFKKQHRQHFRLKAHEVLMFLVAIAGPIGALAWRYLS